MSMQRAVMLLACVARAAALATGVRGAASPPPKAMIAGGGIGGLFTALTLHNEGYDVSVFEKTREYRSFGGPIQIASNGLEAVPSSRLTRRPPSPAVAPHGQPCHSHGPGRFPTSWAAAPALSPWAAAPVPSKPPGSPRKAAPGSAPRPAHRYGGPGRSYATNQA